MKSQNSKRENKKKKRSNIEVNDSFDSNKISSRLFLVLFIGVIILGLLVYSNTFNVPFYYDDYDSIIDNPQIKNLQYFERIPSITDFTQRFVSYLTIALNYKYSQLEVQSYHIVNIFIHLMNTALVMFLILITLNTPVMLKKFSADKKKILILTAGLVFAVHPIQTQAVTYIIQRMTSLFSLFYLLSVITYAKGRLITIDKSLIGYKKYLFPSTLFLISGISFILGVWSKQTAASLPLAIVIYELIFFRNDSGKINWKIISAIIIPYFLFIIYFIFKIGIPIEADEIPRTHYLFTQFSVLIVYLRFLILPVGLNIDHDFSLISSPANPIAIFSLIGLTILIFIGIKLIKKEPIISFAVFWYFITLSVESSIIPIRDIFVEHRLYLPVFGFSLLISYFLIKYINKTKYLYAVLTTIILIMSILTYQRNELWNDPAAMWTDSINKSPQKDRPYLARGSFYLHNNLFDLSIADMKKVTQINPNSFKALDNLGFAYQEKGDYQSALDYHNKAIRINPNFATAYNNRGVCYIYLQDWDSAEKDFLKAVSLFGNYTDAYFNLGYVYFYKQDYLSSIRYLNIVLGLEPNYSDIYTFLAANYILTNQKELAINTISIMRQKKIILPASLMALMRDNNIE